MTEGNQINRYVLRNRILLILLLCLGGCGLLTISSAKKKVKQDDRVYLIHADELRYNAYGTYPPAQIVKGKVSFRHQGATLTCDSAYFYQELNSVKAFGHVHENIFIERENTVSMKISIGYMKKRYKKEESIGLLLIHCMYFSEQIVYQK